MSRWGFLLASIALGLLLASNAGANPAGIHPDLESILAGKGDRDEVPVIVILAQAVDLESLGSVTGKARRSAMIRAMKRFAAFSQVPLKAFLDKEGVAQVQSLWLINGLAVKARPGVIRKLAKFPGTGSFPFSTPLPSLDLWPKSGIWVPSRSPRCGDSGFEGKGWWWPTWTRVRM